MARRGRGSGRVKIRLIMNTKKRNRTLKSRLPVVLKKAHELAVLADVPVCLVAYGTGEAAEPVTWPSPGAAADVVRQYRAMPDWGKLNNKLDSMDYAKQMNDKVRAQVSRVQAQTREEEIKRVMADFLAGRRVHFDDLPADFFVSVGTKVKGKRRAVQHACLQNLRSAPALLLPPPHSARFQDVQMVEPLAMLPPTVPLQMVAAPLHQNNVEMTTQMMLEPAQAAQHDGSTPMTLNGEPRHGSYLFEVLDAFGDPGDGSAFPSTEELHAVFVQAGIFSPPLSNPRFNP